MVAWTPDHIRFGIDPANGPDRTAIVAFEVKSPPIVRSTSIGKIFAKPYKLVTEREDLLIDPHRLHDDPFFIPDPVTGGETLVRSTEITYRQNYSSLPTINFEMVELITKPGDAAEYIHLTEMFRNYKKTIHNDIGRMMTIGSQHINPILMGTRIDISASMDMPRAGLNAFAELTKKIMTRIFSVQPAPCPVCSGAHAMELPEDLREEMRKVSTILGCPNCGATI